MDRDDNFTGIRNDDPRAFDALVHRYDVALNAFALHIVGSAEAAEEIVQDVFMNLWLNRKKVDFGAPLRNYLYVSTRNMAYNYLRSANRYDDRIRKFETDASVAYSFMVEEEALRLLDEAIDRLPPRTAEVIRMSLEGMKQEEIAERMNVTLSNVKNLKSIGIRRLKELLGPLFILLFMYRG